MHQPVLLKEVLEILNPRPGQTYVDATVNGGGHAREIAQRVGEKGRVIGIDWDCDIIRGLRAKNQELGIRNMDLVCENYRRLAEITRHRGMEQADGILFDLGFSSYHMDHTGRGFSFSKDESLDMRYHPDKSRMTAADVVDRYSEKELSDIFLRYGEERFARRIAAGIATERRAEKITTTGRLAAIVRRAYPAPARGGRLHPATRVFQALRIAVNDELASLDAALPPAVSLLTPGGRLAVISFHSLEDRIAKQYMRQAEKEGSIRIVTAKPIRPGEEEVRRNPRARSARLRVCEKIYEKT